jgi:glucosamine-6-phosphate deaminase
MNIIVSDSKNELGQQAALLGASLIQKAIEVKGAASIIVATGASQFEMLSALVQQTIDWSKVSAFHLDEYIGIPVDHPASFRKYLKERFVEKVHPGAFFYVDGEQDAISECNRLSDIISQHTIDVAFVGIGENGHLAFNDPPADFETKDPFMVVELDEDCRIQQLNEGWFNNLSEVPKKAISMSINQIMKSKSIVCSVPDKRKSVAVYRSLYGPVTLEVPASILQQHPNAHIFLDPKSASEIPVEKR